MLLDHMTTQWGPENPSWSHVMGLVAGTGCGWGGFRPPCVGLSVFKVFWFHMLFLFVYLCVCVCSWAELQRRHSTTSDVILDPNKSQKSASFKDRHVLQPRADGWEPLFSSVSCNFTQCSQPLPLPTTFPCVSPAGCIRSSYCKMNSVLFVWLTGCF